MKENNSYSIFPILSKYIWAGIIILAWLVSLGIILIGMENLDNALKIYFELTYYSVNLYILYGLIKFIKYLFSMKKNKGDKQ